MRTSAIVFVSCWLVSCSVAPDQPPITKADQPFASAGSIDMRLDAGDYTIRAAADEHIRVSFAGNYGDAVADLKATGTQANLAVTNAPKKNFHVTVEVPATADLAIHLSAGDLKVGDIKGNKDIDSTAGDVEISVPNSSDYRSVDASVKAGDLNGGPLGGGSAGVSPHLTWSGPGKYTLHATLGAGDMVLKR